MVVYIVALYQFLSFACPVIRTFFAIDYSSRESFALHVVGERSMKCVLCGLLGLWGFVPPNLGVYPWNVHRLAPARAIGKN